MNLLRNVRYKLSRDRVVQAKNFSSTEQPPQTASRYKLERLNSRSIIRLQGDLVTEFLQSLTTNDMNHLSQQSGIFTMFLNKAGRVLHDAIVYRTREPGQLFLECDRQADADLVKVTFSLSLS